MIPDNLPNLSIFILNIILISFLTQAKDQLNESLYEIDFKETDKKHQIELLSGKHGSTRYFKGVITNRMIEQSIDNVLQSVLKFNDRCNNEFSQKREFIAKDFKCPYFNKSIIESYIENNINSTYTKEQHETQRFLIFRNIYNRQKFSQTDLVIVKNYNNDKNEKVYEVTQRMLNDQESEKYFKNAVKKNSVFLEISGRFLLIQKGPKQTSFEYTYQTTTDHWLLNKSVSVSQIFSTMIESLASLEEAIIASSKN